MDDLTISESGRLEELERVIDAGMQTFVHVGNALLEIRDSRLYRQTHGTFEEYCRDRWQMERRHAYRLIDAAQVVENVSNWTQIEAPATESQARPLAALAPDAQRQVWQQAVETAPNGKVTAAHVQSTVNEYRNVDIVESDDEDEIPDSCWNCCHRITVYDGDDIDICVLHQYTIRDDSYPVCEMKDWEDNGEGWNIKAPLRKWTRDQLRRRALVESGVTVHANMKTDHALIEWAKGNGLFERVDRATDWGNPFILPADGDRQTVVENYQIYLDMKPSLLAKLHTLKGKVLGCWCYPELCHAEILEEYADDRAD